MKKIISVLVACACILSALPIAFLTVADNEPSVAHTGDNSLQVYNFVHTWDTVKIDIKNLMGTAVPENRQVKLNVTLSYLIESETEKNDLAFAPKVYLSTDAKSVKEFAFSGTVNANTKKWVTFNGDITCDLSDTTGDKIEWAYITPFVPGDTEIAVYVDDIKITSGNDILLDEGFESFSETTTTKDLVNHGIQTQWGGGESECLYKIATVKATEKAPEYAHTGDNSLQVYNFVHTWDTVKIDIKNLMGTAVPENRQVKLNVTLSYLIESETEKNDLAFAPKVYLSTDAKSVKEFAFSGTVNANTKKWVTFNGDITCDLSDTTGDKIEWAYITPFVPGDTEIAVYVDDIKITSGSDILLDEGFESFSGDTTVKELNNAGIQTQWGGGPEAECSFKIKSLKKQDNPGGEDDGKTDDGKTDEPEETPSIVHGGTKALLVYDLVNPWDSAKFELKKLVGLDIASNKSVTLHIEISYLLKSKNKIKSRGISPKVVFSADEKTSKEYEFKAEQRANASTGSWVTFNGNITCDLTKLSGNEIKWAYITLFNIDSTEIDVYVDDITVQMNGSTIAAQDFEELNPSATLDLLKSNGIQTQWSGGPDKECSLKIVSTVEEIIAPKDPATGWKGEVCKGTKALRVYNRVEEYVVPMFDIRRSDLVGYRVKNGDIFEFDVSIAYKLGSSAKASKVLMPVIQINYADGTSQQFWSTTAAGVEASKDSGWAVYSGKIKCDFNDSKWQNKGSSSVAEGSEIKRVILKTLGGTYGAGTCDLFVDEISIKYKGEEMCPYGSFEMLADSQLTTAGFFFEYGGIGKMEITEGKGAAASDRDGSKFRIVNTASDNTETANSGTVNGGTINSGGIVNNGTDKKSDGAKEKTPQKEKSNAALIIIISAAVFAVACGTVTVAVIQKKKKRQGN